MPADAVDLGEGLGPPELTPGHLSRGRWLLVADEPEDRR
jgi:hypothetical protein